MKCELCEARLLEYLYGELGEEDAAAMERHLEASEACRREYEGLASLLETVAGAEEEGPPPAVHTRIMAHAEEARTGRRSPWAWMFRPAVTTAVIGAVAAGVYFTTLRLKPPSYLDERILSEESLLGKSKQRSAPSSSGAKVDAPGKEAKDQAFRARPAEPPVAIEREGAAPERKEALEKSEMRMPAHPSGQGEPFKAADAMDEETYRPPTSKKAGTPPAEEDRALAGGEERSPGPAYGIRAQPTAPSVSPDRDLPAEETQVSNEIARALDLASQGRCAEARKRIEAYAIAHPKEEACGAGWLEAARCYANKGDIRAAKEMAEKALGIAAHESEARAFLNALPSPAE